MFICGLVVPKLRSQTYNTLLSGGLKRIAVLKVVSFRLQRQLYLQELVNEFFKRQQGLCRIYQLLLHPKLKGPTLNVEFAPIRFINILVIQKL